LSDKKLKKQSFLHGAVILAVATMIVKVIGACYKIPLVRIIGNQGNTYFLAAYDIYSVLLTISTAGLPVAMSRMISEAQTLGNYKQIKRIYKASLYVFLTIGIIGSAGMLLFCKQLANFMNTPNAWIAIAALAPAVLFVCVISSFRGFFQGQSVMTPTAVSQVIEAFSKLFIGLAFAWLITRAGFGSEYAAGGAIAGVTIGIILSFLYLLVQHRRASATLTDLGGSDTTQTMRQTMKTLLAIAVPITLGSAGLQIINLIDSKLVVGQLVGSAGFSQDDAEELRGIYGACQTLFNMPSAFITPITISVIPSITAHLTMKNRTGALKVEESAVRIMALLTMPCGIGLSVLSAPILQMLYGYQGDTLTTGTPLLAILGVCVIFNCLVLLTNAIMQAHGDVLTPVIHMLIGGIVKVILNYILVGRPAINITGAPIGTLTCYIVITVLNLVAMRRKMERTPRVLGIMVKPLLATAAMALAAFMSYDVLHTYLGSLSVACLGAIVCAVIVYAVFVLVLRIITLDDCLLLPKGEKIAKFLHIR
jgi:stage V sporulation protein B